MDIYDALTLKYSDDVNKLKQLFQIFTKLYFFCEPSVCNQFRNVWLYSDVPLAIKKQLGFDGQDYDIDLILEDQEGYLSVVQSRFCVDQSASLSWKKNPLHVLPSGERKVDFHIIFTNASNFIGERNVHFEKENTLKVFSLSELFHISTHTIEKMKRTLLNLISDFPIKKTPRDYQQIAIDNVLKGFKQAERGQLIMPCGTGKTLISLWIYENLKPNYTLVLFPSLALLRQTKNEWAENQEHYIPYMCVCSEKDINKTSDNPQFNLYDISGLVSTDPHVIKTFLQTHTHAIVFSTYQSLEAIANAMRDTDFSFDLALCDEAHKTAGKKNGLYGFIHDDINIRVKKRLYMTATPRILGENIKNRLNEEEICYLADMGNPTQFGYEFHHMSFKDAIDQKILVDYKIIAMGVSDAEVNAVMKERHLTNTDVTKAEIANNYALEKFMSKYQSAHAITFHSSVKKARGFQERHIDLFQGVDVFHVNGKQSTNDRNSLLKKFEASPKSIVTNARCLTEGVDVPVIDAVYFSDPKNSKIDIVQATGRALRRADHRGKEIGYIVVPIFHQNKDLLEESIEEGAFNNVVSVIRSLSNQDERLRDFFNAIKMVKRDHSDPTDRIIANQNMMNLITIEDLGDFHDCLFDQVVSKIRAPWRFFQEARAFIHTLNFKNMNEWKEYCKSGNKPYDIPVAPEIIYKQFGWISIGDWLGTGVVASRLSEYKPFEEARAFVRSLNLKNMQEYRKEWKKHSYIGGNLYGIPVNPNLTYKLTGWLSPIDWLGSGRISSNNKRIFQEARAFVHTLGLQSMKEWEIYCKSGNKPNDIPFRPSSVYKKEGWISFCDWLGKEEISPKLREYKTFQEARTFVHTLNLKNIMEWRVYCKNGNKPCEIPKEPNVFYKNGEWISFPDWLGVERASCKNKRSFLEARAFVHTLNLNTYNEWKTYCKDGKKPNDIPLKPERVYKDKGWLGFSDWIGNGKITARNTQYRTFSKARKFVHTLNLKSTKEWLLYSRSGMKPNDIPGNPQFIYKNKWVSVGDWLGHGRIADQLKQYKPFADAREFVHDLNLNTMKEYKEEWRKHSYKGGRLENFPCKPEKTYKKCGWISSKDWLRKTEATVNNLRDSGDIVEKFSKPNETLDMTETSPQNFVSKDSLALNFQAQSNVDLGEIRT